MNPHIRKNYEPGAPPPAFIEALEAALRETFKTGATDAKESNDLKGISFDWIDENATKYARTRGAELIGMKRLEDGSLVPNPNAEWNISETTRSRVNEMLEQAMAEGWSPDKFGDRLSESFAFSDSRAEAIARTEVAIAQNAGQTHTMREAGYDRLFVYDGDGCPECAAVDGKVCSIQWATDNPLEHPSCTRSFSSAPEDEPIDLD